MTKAEYEAIAKPTDLEWERLTDCGGRWELLEKRLAEYGERVAREAALKADTEKNMAITMSIDGATFKASGPKSTVDKLYMEWREMSGLELEPLPSQKQFNAPRWKR